MVRAFKSLLFILLLSCLAFAQPTNPVISFSSDFPIAKKEALGCKAEWYKAGKAETFVYHCQKFDHSYIRLGAIHGIDEQITKTAMFFGPQIEESREINLPKGNLLWTQNRVAVKVFAWNKAETSYEGVLLFNNSSLPMLYLGIKSFGAINRIDGKKVAFELSPIGVVEAIKGRLWFTATYDKVGIVLRRD